MDFDSESLASRRRRHGMSVRGCGRQEVHCWTVFVCTVFETEAQIHAVQFHQVERNKATEKLVLALHEAH